MCVAVVPSLGELAAVLLVLTECLCLCVMILVAIATATAATAATKAAATAAPGLNVPSLAAVDIQVHVRRGRKPKRLANLLQVQLVDVENLLVCSEEASECVNCASRHACAQELLRSSASARHTIGDTSGSHPWRSGAGSNCSPPASRAGPGRWRSCSWGTRTR